MNRFSVLRAPSIAFLASFLILAGLTAPRSVKADRYESLVHKASRHVRKNQLDKALKVFKEAVRVDPNESWGYFNVGNVARKVNKCRDVVLYFRGFLYLSPGTDDDKIARKNVKKCTRGAGIGTLSLTTEPKGAEIVLDGVVVAQTPESGLELVAGTYKMELNHPDCEGLSREIIVKAGESTKLEEKLIVKPAFGYLEVKVDPADGVKVYLDEKEIGVTPFDEVRLETRKYLLRLEKAGYDRWVRNVTIRKDRTYRLQATMERSEEVTSPPLDR